MSGRLAGKVAVVTGAAPRAPGLGNGKATAILFAREGAKVVLVNRDADRGRELEAEIRAEGGEASAFAADVCDPEQARAMADFAVERYGRLDVLHNNVGIGNVPGTPETVELDDWNRLFAANVTSAMLCCKFCIPKMLENGSGSIINVSTIAAGGGLSGSPGAVAYASSKSAMHGLTLSVAADYAPKGIRCNCVIVGSVATPMVAHLGAEAQERRRRMVPMQTEGTAWDVAWAAVYLASEESRWVTGVFLPVDGGLLAIRPWPR